MVRTVFQIKLALELSEASNITTGCTGFVRCTFVMPCQLVHVVYHSKGAFTENKVHWYIRCTIHKVFLRKSRVMVHTISQSARCFSKNHAHWYTWGTIRKALSAKTRFIGTHQYTVTYLHILVSILCHISLILFPAGQS